MLCGPCSVPQHIEQGMVMIMMSRFERLLLLWGIMVAGHTPLCDKWLKLITPSNPSPIVDRAEQCEAP